MSEETNPHPFMRPLWSLAECTSEMGHEIPNIIKSIEFETNSNVLKDYRSICKNKTLFLWGVFCLSEVPKSRSWARKLKISKEGGSDACVEKRYERILSTFIITKLTKTPFVSLW